MDDTQALIDVVNGVAIHTDLREWDAVRRLYADQVMVDYTSFVDGSSGEVNANDLIANWRTSLGRYRATQHLLGNHRVQVNGDHADILVYVQATHWLPQAHDASIWTVHGWYAYQLRHAHEGWQITHHTFTATIVYGSQTLLKLQGVKAAWLDG